MPIRHKRKTVAGYTWLPADLVEGQVGLNIADGSLHFKKSDNSIVQLDDQGTKILVQDTQPTDTSYLWLDTTDPADPGIQTRANRIVVREEADFGTGVAGVIQLLDNTLYEVNGSVTTTNTLNFGTNTMIRGSHMGLDAIVYVGGLTAITATNVNCFMNNVAIVAPGATAVNLTGGLTDEFLWTLVSIINCANLGTITGFRVPSIINCNFDTFDNGLVFEGTTNKVYLQGCPIRNFTNFGIHFGATYVSEVIDISANYFKDSPTGTGVIFNATATLTVYGLMRGTNFTDVLTPVSGFGPATDKWDFQNNDPIRDSRRIGSIFMSGNTTATVLLQDVWTKVVGVTSIQVVERFTMPESNRLTYSDARSGAQGLVIGSISILGTTNNQEVDVAIYRNGVIASPEMKSILTGTARTDSISINAVIDFNQGDYVELWIRTRSANNNATIQDLQLTVSA